MTIDIERIKTSLQEMKTLKTTALTSALDKDINGEQRAALLILGESFGVAEVKLQIALVTAMTSDF